MQDNLRTIRLVGNGTKEMKLNKRNPIFSLSGSKRIGIYSDEKSYICTYPNLQNRSPKSSSEDLKRNRERE